MPDSANQILLERSIRHAVYLERLKTSEVRRLVAFFNKDVAPDILMQIEKRLGSGTVTEKRLKELYKSIKSVSTQGMMQIGDDFTDSLRDIGVTDAEWYQAALSDAVPVDIDFRTPHFGMLKAKVSNDTVCGKTVQEWFKGISATTAGRVRQQINIGIAQGENYPKIVRRIRGTRSAGFANGILNASRRDIEAVVRTSVATAAQTAREEVFKTNTAVVKGVQLVATLDNRTTEICMGYDGKVFAVDDGPRPPFHFQCRTQAIPVIRSWKELGISLKEAPEGTRSSMNGQVPAKMTYGQWLKKQSISVQDDVLGPTRARLFRSGKVRIDRFAKDGRKLTLAELRKREGLKVMDVKPAHRSAG